MTRVGLLVSVVLAGLALAPAAQAQALPPCTPTQGGRLASFEVRDTAANSSTRLYATHRLSFKLNADNGNPEDPDETRYRIEGGSERLAAAPGVLGPTTYVAPAAGARSLLVNWTVNRAKPFETSTPFCTGADTLSLSLRRPRPTRLKVKRNLTDPSKGVPRLLVSIAGRAGDSLAPLDVRIRRGSRGRRRKLFTLPLDAAADNTVRRFAYRGRAAGVAVSATRRDAAVETSGLVTLGVKVPSVGDGRRVRRSFTLELARAGRVLLRVRAVVACRGLGRAPALQACSTPVYRVTRP